MLLDADGTPPEEVDLYEKLDRAEKFMQALLLRADAKFSAKTHQQCADVVDAIHQLKMHVLDVVLKSIEEAPEAQEDVDHIKASMDEVKQDLEKLIKASK